MEDLKGGATDHIQYTKYKDIACGVTRYCVSVKSQRVPISVVMEML